MKALYFDGEKAVYREDVPMPVRGEGQSLIRIMLADICSTDKEILKGYRPDFKGVMGHEFVGKSSKAQMFLWSGRSWSGRSMKAAGSVFTAAPEGKNTASHERLRGCPKTAALRNT